jgi:hypothetical protein
LFGFGFHFFDGVVNLQYLYVYALSVAATAPTNFYLFFVLVGRDLSSNSLTVPYAGSTVQRSCNNQLCAIETL